MCENMPNLDYEALIEKTPGLPLDFAEIANILSKDDIYELERFILKEPIITSRVIAAANSAAVSRARIDVLSIRQAIARIGNAWVKNIILTSLYSGKFDSTRCPLFDKKKYWSESLRIGIIADSVADILDHPCDQIRSGGMIAGLISKVGLPFMAHHFPDEMNRALFFYINQDPGQPKRRLSQFIYESTRLDYKHIGTMILEHWGVPKALSQVPSSNKLQPRTSGDLRALLAFVRAWSKEHFSDGARAVTALPARDRQKILDRREAMLKNADLMISLINQ